MINRRKFQRIIPAFLAFLLFCGILFSKESDKNQSGQDSGNSKSKLPVQGCCRIKMKGGGYDYFTATEEECATHKQFHSFLKERTLCFESFPE
ncbi:hypothetical protein AB3N59_07155 [Leptospira sp. WS92.C1]